MDCFLQARIHFVWQFSLHISNILWDILFGKGVQKYTDQTSEGKPTKPLNIPPPDKFFILHPILPKITLQQKHSLSTTEDTAQQIPVQVQDCTPVEVDPQQDNRPSAPPQTAEPIINNSLQ